MVSGGFTSFQRGRDAERTAERFLLRQGLKLIQRNYRGRRGEIDLVMEDADTLVFVEVKSRTAMQHGEAIEAIDLQKQTRIIRTANEYLAQQNQNRYCRFDAIGFNGAVSEQNLQWIKNAFSG